MTRPTYITEEFYKVIQRESDKYSKDYRAIQERTKVLDELQKKVEYRDEESYSLLKNFGAM